MTDIPTDVALETPKSWCSLERFSRWVLALALLVVVASFVAFLLLALPAHDDYIRATQPHMYQRSVQGLVHHEYGFGYWAYCRKLYMEWQGRWVAFCLEAAILSRGDMTKIYPALLGAVAVVNVAGLCVVCRRMTSLGSRWFSLACAVGLGAVLWAEMPSTAQAVYWFTGVVENAMPMALAGILLAGLITMRASVPWMIFASVLAIVTCGLHESYGTMLCIALALGTAAAYWMKSENRTAWLVVLIAAVVGLAIVVGAPGNRVRMSHDGPKQARHMVAILRLAAVQFWNSGRAWIFDPKLLAASLWVAFSPSLEAARPIWPNAKKVPWRLLLPVAWLCMLGVGFFAPSYAFGNEMPPRTLTGNFLVFASGWLLIVFVWTRRVDLRDTVSSSYYNLRSVGGSAVARLALALGLVLTGNTMEGLHDLATRHVLHWRSSVQARYALLRHGGDADLVLPRQASSSRLLYAGEITTDPTYWSNKGLAAYFHVKSVCVKPIATSEPATAVPPVPESDSKAPNM